MSDKDNSQLFNLTKTMYQSLTEQGGLIGAIARKVVHFLNRFDN